MTRATIVLLFALGAQSSPFYEVASVKVTTTPGMWGVGPERVRFDGTDLRTIIGTAYDIPNQLHHLKIVGGSLKLMRETYFQIEIKGTEEPRAMLRAVLADRFGLKVREEVRDTPVYAMEVKRAGRLGPYLKPSTFDCRKLGPENANECRQSRERRGGAFIQHSHGPITELMIRQAQANLNRPIIDRTGLTGLYEWEVAYGHSPGDMEIGFEDQLGLVFKPTTAPFTVLVIDHVQMPTPN